MFEYLDVVLPMEAYFLWPRDSRTVLWKIVYMGLVKDALHTSCEKEDREKGVGALSTNQTRSRCPYLEAFLNDILL